ncbi:MAG: SpoIIE family protein phosphatase [Actinobacteria bacterium]|nr:SpoIIE family protein phosphatase [Actinomycetota bacterium]
MQVFIDLFVELVKSMAVIIMVAYLFTRTRLYRQVLDRRLGRQGRALLILIFGAFSIWGTLAGVEILGGIANTRDLGPALGGLLAGPVVGVGAGLIGAAQRLTMGGFTAVPCALATVAAGFSGGVVYLLFKRRLAPVWAAMLLALFTESLHMGLTLLMARPYDKALALVGEVMVPMIVVNAIGMGVFVLIIRNEERERVTRVQKERMEGELNVAREIQLGIVPAIFPPFPEREEFDLHASLESAREVGGDLYDFFLLDDDHLCMAIGDVSGKGVPASLFMAVTITLLRAVGHRTSLPDEVLARVNAPLCRDNDAAMFVTLFFAVCDVRTGEMTYSSGGHPPPYIVRADGAVEPLPRTAGAGLGVSSRIAFGTGTAKLECGDGLLLYTDGVTEAMDAAGGMFGEERLVAALGGVAAQDGAAHMMAAVRAAVDGFTAGAEQYDDITMLGFRRTRGAC